METLRISEIVVLTMFKRPEPRLNMPPALPFLVPSVTRISTSLDYTAALGAGFADVLAFGDIVTLRGDLGAGKTTFVRAVARHLGVAAGLVASPTFVFINQYPYRAADGEQAQLIHVDAYRLTGTDDLDALGWDTLFAPDGSGALASSIALIEWPERIEAGLGGEIANISIRSVSASAREFVFKFPESWSARERLQQFMSREPTRCRVTEKWVSPTSPSYPFFDDRARLADLNRWFTGSYSVTREVKPEDEE